MRKLEKMSLVNIEGKLSRKEMKNVMAGSNGYMCCIGSNCSACRVGQGTPYCQQGVLTAC
ncbi:hypothetical protein JI750_04130 [Flavobacterium sp. GN10]|uniref:Natural product n=1 Tax=Flavobacterium tagetis TaxID=2801336 RepID=A0ABS1K9A0_9FLAO|nr:hypothetical protein [Flavobacterium tagetis]MBL0736060.1 hypothetical protein [Flavobacterium tagetis]